MNKHIEHGPQHLTNEANKTANGRRNRSRIVVTIVIAIVAVAVVLGTLAVRAYGHHRVNATANATAASASAAKRNTSNTKDSKARRAAAEKKKAEDKALEEAKAEARGRLDPLNTQIQQQLASVDGTWQVYVEDLGSGESFSINNHSQQAASDIKLYVMLAVYQSIADGTLTDDGTIEPLMTQMITVSSNQATNDLVTKLGGGDAQQGLAKVNETAKRYGFTQTSMDDLLYDSGPGSPMKKLTSAQDAGKLLAAAYRGTLVSKDASQHMIDLLCQQQRRSKIPAGLPDGTQVGNKTGEIPGTENDAAVVLGGAHPFVLVVMNTDINDSATAQATIRSIASTAWTAFQS